MSQTVFVRQSAACKTLVKVDTALLCLHRYPAILSNGSPRPALLKSREPMGKTGKKVKSDRINAIRKQYDAFLEEDKKRRDRNEYILERLDKMRSSSAIVQVRYPQATNIFTDFNDPVKYDKSEPYIGRSVPIYEKQRYSFNQVNSPKMLTTLNEEGLVKELSKKYILIPKQQSIPVYENIHNKYPIKSCVEDNNDWRSKYNILEELKKSEVEEEVNSKSMLSNELNTNNDSNAEFGETKVDETNVKKVMQVNDPELILKADNNFQKASLNTEDVSSQNTDIEKDLCSTTKPLQDNSTVNKDSNFNVDSKCIKNIKDSLQYTDILTEKEKMQTKHEIESKSRAEEKLTEEVHNNPYSTTDVEHQEHIESLRNAEVIEHDEIKELQRQNYTNPEEDMSEVDCRTVHRDIADIVLNEPSSGVTTTIVEEPNLINTTNTSEVTDTKDDVQRRSTDVIYDRSDDVIGNQDVQSNVIENFNYPVDPGENYEHQTNSGKQEYENTVEETQIQEFESEQNNMFYSEQTESNTYDQSNADNTNVAYTNNESYGQNENYVYYDGTPQDQLYSTEINEHEEATEQYDPNYQNQYDNYAQQDPQSESGKGYETEANNIIESQQYDTQHNYDQALYDETNYNAVEEVEQQLDAEQGYIEPLKELEQKEVIPGNETIEQEVKVS